MKIIFRVDGGTKTGFGHLSRCLSLADYFSKKRAESFFITSNIDTKKIIDDLGYKTYKINLKKNEVQQTKKILNKQNFQILIIDSKRKSILQLLKIKNIKTVLIDNYKYSKFANLTILPSINESNSSMDQNILFGKKYVMLNKFFKKRKLFSVNKSILISMGGSDKYDITSKIIYSLKRKKENFHVKVVLGKFYKFQKKIESLVKDDNRFEIISEIDDMTKIMKKCSIGIITFGITAYEAVMIGLPVFVIAHSSENDISAKKFEKYNCINYIGKIDKINYDSICSEIIRKNKNSKFLKKLYENGKIIDGKGVQRVATKILNLK